MFKQLEGTTGWWDSQVSLLERNTLLKSMADIDVEPSEPLDRATAVRSAIREYEALDYLTHVYLREVPVQCRPSTMRPSSP